MTNLDCLIVQELSGFILPRWVPDFGRTSSYKHDWLVSCFLEMPQDHDLQQTPDMKAAMGRSGSVVIRDGRM